jgi:hypothetical protein
VAGAASEAPGRGLRERLQEADALAVRWAPRWPVALRRLLALSVVLGASGLAIGLLVDDDPAAYFREGMPGTWFSAALLLATALVAWAVHLRDGGADVRRWKTFWGVAAAGFLAFAIVELTQPTVFLGRYLKHHAGAVAPWGIEDVDAFLLIVAFTTFALLLARRALVLLHHRVSVALFAAGAAFAVGSQGLDSTMASTPWEFAAEESLKLAAEPFILAAFLAALAVVLRRDAPER